MPYRVDDLEESFSTSEINLFPVDIDGRGSLESELVPERHIFFDFRHVVSFFHTGLEFSSIEPYLFRDILTLIRADRVSFFLFFESVHFLGEFFILSLGRGTERCECVIRSIFVYVKWIHAVFQTDLARIRVF